jgi:hypothetical protein
MFRSVTVTELARFAGIRSEGKLLTETSCLEYAASKHVLLRAFMYQCCFLCHTVSDRCAACVGSKLVPRLKHPQITFVCAMNDVGERHTSYIKLMVMCTGIHSFYALFFFCTS